MAVSLALLSLGVVAVHDPGPLSPDPELAWSYPAYAHLVRGRPAAAPRAAPRCATTRSTRRSPATCEAGRSSGRTRTVGRGSAGRSASPTARSGRGRRPCSADIEPEADQPLPPDRRARRLDDRAGRAARARRAGGGRRDREPGPRHRGSRPCGPRSTSSRRRPARSRSCPASSTSSCSIRPTAAGSRQAGIAASVQPVASRDGRASRRGGCGAPAPRRSGYAWGSLAATGAVLAFGTDAPVEPFDPWPGIALAVRREDPRWPAGTPALRAGRGADRRAGACAPRASTHHARRGTGTGAGSSSASTPTWWSSRPRPWPSRSNRAAPSPRPARRWSSSTAAWPTRPDPAAAATTRDATTAPDRPAMDPHDPHARGTTRQRRRSRDGSAQTELVDRSSSLAVAPARRTSAGAPARPDRPAVGPTWPDTSR